MALAEGEAVRPGGPGLVKTKPRLIADGLRN
jgi:hypothetical protein